REVKKGDRLFIYHTGAEKSVVGLATAASNSYPNPKAENKKIVVFDVAPERLLPRPVPLSAIKTDPRFKDFGLVRMSRLSVMPVPIEIEKALLEMSGDGLK